jgi:16S rRNA (cytosine1402-N4)-methyltransferase
VLERLGVRELNAAMIDLGINSAQLSDAGRGFSLDRDGPLDMRFDQGERRQAIDLVNGLGETELADLFYHNAQEGHSRRIAKQICHARRNRRIATTRELAAIVESALEGGRGRTHPATRVFQALRMEVNRELENLERFLDRIAAYLRPGGRLAVISFHSLEDGLVKRFLRGHRSGGGLRELTKRPVGPDRDEMRANPRSRSAKLRVAERTEAV